MKIGILGTGFGSYHAATYSILAGSDSVRIYGRDEEKLKEIKQDLQIDITNNMEEILTDNEIGLIDICLPSSLHKEFAIKAIQNGKHVFCETPVALTLEDALTIQKTAREYNKKVFVNLFIRHEGPYVYLFDIMKANTLGKLKALHIRRKTPHLWGDLGLNNIITNFMLHEFDFVTWLLGKPDNITASGVEGKAGESHVITLLNYKEVIVEVHASSMMPDYHPFTVGYEAIFENGTIEYIENGYIDREEKSLILYTNEKQERVELPESNCYEAAMKHVLECCQSDVEPRLSIDEAIVSLEIALSVKELLQKDKS